MIKPNFNEALIKNNTIAVIGAGGWGTALSTVLVKNGFDVKIWALEEETADDINYNHRNSVFLPNITLSNRIIATNNFDDIRDEKFIISAVPTQFIRSLFINNKFDFKDKYILNIAKGIEKNTLLRCSQIFIELGLQPECYAILTGPSHAEEVARQMPTTVVSASDDYDFAMFIQNLISSDYLRIYTNEDVIGCEIGGSIKNVIAISAGIIEGLELGDNTKAALITRGLAEISRLAIAMGANPYTLFGLAGLGDLFVTCNSKHSRNRYVGEMIGKGLKLSQILANMKMVAEGVETAVSANELSRLHNVDMPIVQKVYQILFEDLDPNLAIHQLMTRSAKHEWL
ncbi:MAG TPA: NAD(P)H-dependent glycerol-3-phosphate dehydrogenase [Candidatus Kapabacteria bacterium]|jgi:glycerol-3-phosphate dehydrogenase (NAD(P)+)|nr:NAD(P)H-dependent glycerol-3-phosphate dehydrogenase [Candidatus Kapabacteria bacterium]